MTTTMSMRERHKRVEELVMQDPLVCERANEFNDAQREINEWHVRNSPTAHATMGQLAELDELITFSEFCLEDLKCAKTAAYNQLMSQYPRVWDTSCDDPFFYTTAQTTAPEDGAEREETATLPETEEMSTVPEPDMFILPPVATLHVTSCNPALRDWIMRLDHDTTPSDSPDHLTDAEREETATLPETEEMSAVPAAKIAHSHNLTASTAECPLCSMLDRDRIDARAALAARAQNLHMLTDKYIHQLENGTLGYDGLGEWTDRLLEAGDDWSSHQSAVTNAEWRYRNAITVHSDLAAARRCETEEMEEVPTPNPLIRADKLMGILDREEAAYKVTIGFCDLWDLDASDLHARLATIQAIRTQLERLIDEAKETTNA